MTDASIPFGSIIEWASPGMADHGEWEAATVQTVYRGQIVTTRATEIPLAWVRFVHPRAEAAV